MTRRAGQSAKQRFREERRRTIRENPREVLFFVGAVAVCAIWLVLADGVWRQVAALLLGSSATILAFGWRLGFDARSLRWLWGAAGEEWTATELERLGPEWHVIHDVQYAGGNWDHIAVGPPGVFVIDSKNLTQPGRVDDRGLIAGRLRFDGSATRGSAVRAKELLEQHTGISVWAQGTLVVWGSLDGGTQERDKVLYVPGHDLVEILTARPRKLNADVCATLAAALRSVDTPARSEPAPA